MTRMQYSLGPLVIVTFALFNTGFSAEARYARSTMEGCPHSRPLGMKSGAIKDTQIRGRGSQEGTKPSDARLDGPRGWCASLKATLRSSTQIEIDLGALYKIDSIVFQAGTRGAPIMGKFILRYRKRLDEPWLSYKENGRVKVIDVQGYRRKDPFVAQYLVLFPFSSKKELACVRMEFYGCIFVPPTTPPTSPPDRCPALSKPTDGKMIANSWSNGSKVGFECNENFVRQGSQIVTCVNGVWSAEAPTCEGCPAKLGMENGDIKDSQITGEGSYHGSKQYNARLHGKYAWCAVLEREFKIHTFIRIDLKTLHRINRIIIQDGMVERAMPKFLLRHKKHWDDTWIDYSEDEEKFKVITPADSVISKPFVTRYLALYPFADKRVVACLRMELKGCPVSDCPPCSPTVGLKTACKKDSSPYDFGVVLTSVSITSGLSGVQNIQGKVKQLVFSKIKFLLRESFYYTFTRQVSIGEKCLCPAFKANTSYLVFGKLKDNKFIVDETSLVEEWRNNKLVKKVRKRCIDHENQP